MGDKRTFYASVFNYLLKMVNKYFTSGSIPWEGQQEYDFFMQFHREMDELLQLGQCRLIAELYRIFNGSVHCRQLSYCNNPKQMLCELWNAFAGWTMRPYDAGLQEEIVKYIEEFTKKWEEQEIAVNLVIVFANEISDMKQTKKDVA